MSQVLGHADDAKGSIPEASRMLRARTASPLAPGLLVSDLKMQLFLSHATADGELVARIQSELAPLGAAVYMAEHDNQAGVNVHAKIGEALRASDLVIVLLTEAGFDSRYVHQEIGAALNAEKLVIPLVTGAVARADLGELQGIEYIVLDRKDPAQAMRRLTERIDGLQVQRQVELLQRQQAARELTVIAGIALVVIGVVLLASTE